VWTERGSASVLVLGWMVCLIIGASLALALGAGVVTLGSLQAATDRAALAGADVLTGVAGDLPCTLVQDIVVAEGFAVVSCQVHEHGVRVVSGVELWGSLHTRRAHAGVADSGQK
jgi:secretion/DNA translocation related TadE-like protein